jgi:hypothetical protein
MVLEMRHLARGVDAIDPTTPGVLDAPRRHGPLHRRRRLRRHRDRRRLRRDHMQLSRITDASLDQVVVQQQDSLVRRRRALERDRQDREQHLAAAKPRQLVTQPLSAVDRVILEATLHEARRSRHVIVGTQRHHQEIRVVGRRIGSHLTASRVDREHCLLPERHTWLCQTPIRQPHSIAGLMIKKDVQLGEAQSECIVLVD